MFLFSVLQARCFYSARLIVFPFDCRSGASLLSTTDCQSPKRRWPEDIAWHPHGNSLFSVYTADSGESQVSVLNLNRTQGVRAVVEKMSHLFVGISW